MKMDEQNQCGARNTKSLILEIEETAGSLEPAYGEILGLIKALEAMHKTLDEKLDSIVARTNAIRAASQALVSNEYKGA